MGIRAEVAEQLLGRARISETQGSGAGVGDDLGAGEGFAAHSRTKGQLIENAERYGSHEERHTGRRHHDQ